MPLPAYPFPVPPEVERELPSLSKAGLRAWWVTRLKELDDQEPARLWTKGERQRVIDAARSWED